jgi:thioredoxin-dependent peroxiredoxin
MMTAPQFSLPDQTGATRSLPDFAGKWLVLYFYPEDDTPGCTTEACGFRDWREQLEARGLRVVGMSPDDVASHARFAKKYGLNFPLLADVGHSVIEAYGAWGPKRAYGKDYVGVTRKTVLINPEGEIAREYPKVKPEGHAEQILADFEGLTRIAP